MVLVKQQEFDANGQFVVTKAFKQHGRTLMPGDNFYPKKWKTHKRRLQALYYSHYIAHPPKEEQVVSTPPEPLVADPNWLGLRLGYFLAMGLHAMKPEPHAEELDTLFGEGATGLKLEGEDNDA
jgi:hypothetical protein